MPKHTVYVTRDASITYATEVDLPLEEIKERCGKYGFRDADLNLDWEICSVSSYDAAEAYKITHGEQRIVDGFSVTDEVTDDEWEMG
jgi:hypothetical protein